MLSAVQQHKTGLYAYSCEYCKYTSEEFKPAKSGSHSGSAANASNVATAASESKSPLTSHESNTLSARIKEAEQNVGATATFAYLAAHYKARYKAGVAAAAAATAAAGMVGFSGSSSGGLQGSASARSKAQLFDEFESLLAESDAANPLLGGNGGSGGGGGSGAHHARALSRPEFTPTPAGSSESQLLESSNVGRWMRWRSDRDALLHNQHYILPAEPIHNNFDGIPHALLGYFESPESKVGPHGPEDLASLSQRLAHPAGQHFLVSELVPRRKALQTKLAHRCSQCLKHLVKPGPGASKPTFEILSSALSFLPALSVAPFGVLRVGVAAEMVVYVKNSLEKGVRLWITLPDDAEEQSKRLSAAQSKGVPLPSVRSPTALVQFARSGFPIILAAFDDLAEENIVWHPDGIHGSGSVHAPKDPVERDAGLVVYRHLSKVGLKLTVTPQSSEQATHFILLVHTQADNNADAPAAAATATATATPASPATAAAAAAAAPIHTFAMHVNLGFAQP